MAIRHLLLWEPQPEYPGSQVDISRNVEFTDVIQSVPYTTELCLLTDPIASAGTYYWRVRGVGLLSTGEWSETRQFVIQPAWSQPTYQLVTTRWCYPILLRRS